MKIFEKTIRIHSRDVTPERQLRLSHLLGFFQEISITHTEILGIGREKTLDRGLLWVIARQSVEITRMPRYDEVVTFRSWPGPTMRVFFPRHYEVVSGSDVIARGCAVWMLIDAGTRHFAFPDEYDINIEGFEEGSELPPPRSLSSVFRNTEAVLFRDETIPVRYSYLDINGHVNNCKYFDIVEDIIPLEENRGYDNTLIEAEYLKEIRPGDSIRVRAYKSEDSRFFDGGDEKSSFRILMSHRRA